MAFILRIRLDHALEDGLYYAVFRNRTGDPDPAEAIVPWTLLQSPRTAKAGLGYGNLGYGILGWGGIVGPLPEGSGFGSGPQVGDDEGLGEGMMGFSTDVLRVALPIKENGAHFIRVKLMDSAGNIAAGWATPLIPLWLCSPPAPPMVVWPTSIAVDTVNMAWR